MIASDAETSSADASELSAEPNHRIERAKHLKRLWLEDERFSSRRFAKWIGVNDRTARKLLHREEGPPSEKIAMLPASIRSDLPKRKP